VVPDNRMRACELLVFGKMLANAYASKTLLAAKRVTREHGVT
jgi:hypothetical protein